MFSQSQPKISVKDFYTGKNILLTGCTGFIGKVILEKLLRSCSTLNNVYVLVRPKRGKRPMDRVKNEILSSFSFTEIKEKYQDGFEAFIESKIVPIEADLTADNLGMSPESRQLLINNCNMVINCAASVKFDDPLQEALIINYFGTL